MRKFKCLLGAFVLAAGFVVARSVSYAKPEYTKTEKAKCVVCHTKGKELNKVGECWEETKKLAECVEKEKEAKKEKK